MKRMDAWVRFGAALACADGKVTTEEASSLAALAATLAKLDEATALRYLEEARDGSAPSITSVIDALGASSPDRAIEGLRWCYRIIVADGEEHPAETSVLRLGAAKLLGAGNEDRAVAFLRNDHATVGLRDVLENAAFEAGCQIETETSKGGV